MADELLKEKIRQINELLRSYGKVAVQEVCMKNKDGQAIGRIRYGYRPQYVFDAVNEILFPENWRYEIVSKEVADFQAIVEVRLFIRLENEWLCKGSHTGQMTIVKNNLGDAFKGAVTDGLQKCFSLLSVGSDAYRGLLETVYKQGQQAERKSAPRPQPPSKANSSPAKKLPPSPHNKLPPNLPDLNGVEYQRQNGMVIAVGKTYDKKNLLKSSGFRWDGASKNWYMEVH